MSTAAFGFTAWGSDVVRIAEPLTATTPNTLAPRARRMAGNGGVTLEHTGRQVTAHIHRGAEASVAHLEFAPMRGETVAALREILGSRSEPDDEAHAALRGRGLRPAPELVAADCSCRARTTMCVHVLASLYALAEKIDHEPMTALVIQSFGSADHGTDGAPTPTGPPPRWTPLAGLDVRDFFSVRRPPDAR